MNPYQRSAHTPRIAHVHFHLLCTNCAPHTQPGRGVVITAPPTIRYSEQILYVATCILRRASHRVRYPEFGGCPLFGCFYCIICIETAVGACNSVRYLVDVCYWECQLIESRLYITMQCTCTIWFNVELQRISLAPTP